MKWGSADHEGGKPGGVIEGPSGLGGWLIVLGISLVVFIVYFAYSLSDSMYVVIKAYIKGFIICLMRGGMFLKMV
jgi:hypothetical protein